MTSSTTLKLVEIDPGDEGLLEKIGRLRVAAWSPFMLGASGRPACWLDEFELRARHWCLFDEGEPVAPARMSVHRHLDEVPDACVYEGVFTTPPQPLMASFNRLVVHLKYRGRGLSRRLDEARLEAARALGCRSAIAETHSGTARLAQFRDLGFQVVGPARPYPEQHFACESGVVVLRDAVNEVSQQFIEWSGKCHQPVLDVGAAYGVAAIPALAAGATVYANDMHSGHLAEIHQRTPDRHRHRLTLTPGRFPSAISLPDSSLDAVHASQILHFLTPSEVEAGLHTAFRWLRPGGRLFVMAATPYQATHAGFASVFAARKASGCRWPGVIEDVRAYNTHWSADSVPPWLHVFDDEVLSAGVRRAGFLIEWARMFSRTGLPDFCRLDGRENLGLVAFKPAG